jgi:hypothetical protein
MRAKASHLLALFLGAHLAAVEGPASADAGVCRPRRPLPLVVLRSMGPCNFDVESMSFAGDPLQQAACLMRPVYRWAHLGPPIDRFPKVLADRIGRSDLLPNRKSLAALLADGGLDRQWADGLDDPISRARDGDPFSPMARYFVIHDTSGPKLGSFREDMDTNSRINNLARFRCSDSSEIAHAIINRLGEVFYGHDFAVPWRATKFERALIFGTTLKGLFLHVEMIQPRRSGPGHHGNDVVAPNPGFTTAQYDRLALFYIVASARAGEWLIPAFHAAIDGDIRGGHDDPQNFEIEAFARAVERLLDRLSGEAEAHDLAPALQHIGAERL